MSEQRAVWVNPERSYIPVGTKGYVAYSEHNSSFVPWDVYIFYADGDSTDYLAHDEDFRVIEKEEAVVSRPKESRVGDFANDVMGSMYDDTYGEGSQFYLPGFTESANREYLRVHDNGDISFVAVNREDGRVYDVTVRENKGTRIAKEGQEI